jgi:Ca2+-binding RTX toxin-like protein
VSVPCPVGSAVAARASSLLTGGADADTFIFDGAFGDDIITDFDSGDGDTIELQDFTAGDVDVVTNAAFTQILVDGGGTIVVFGDTPSIIAGDIVFT